jgi:polysaccharide biosynthesis/export protein
MKQALFVIAVSLFISSCAPTREAVYFNELQESRISSNVPIPESIIHPNDILSISVTSLNPLATEIFNIHSSNTNSETANGYLVNDDGNIQFPMLGTLKVSGLTKKQLQDDIASQLTQRKLLTDPIVSIRFLNYKVTVLGEVGKPSVITIPNEKISLLEAIGLAGDLTILARRDNVLIIREENNQKIFARINLNSNEIFRSPYYYLKSNDVVYVEPNKDRISSAKVTPKWLPYTLSGLSIVIGLATLLKN